MCNVDEWCIKMINGFNSNSLYGASAEAAVANRRQQQLAKIYGNGIDMKSAMFFYSGGRQEEVLDRIALETGINETPAEDNISFDKYVTAENDKDNMLFQGTDGNLYNINFTNGTYGAKDQNEFVEENYAGLINPDDKSDKAYDVVEFGQDNAEFINYANVGYGDGCDNVETSIDNFSSATEGVLWGNNIKWVYQEVNLNPTNGADISVYNKFMSNIVSNSTQWMSSEDIQKIQQTEGYEEYIKKIVDRAIKSMSYNDESGFSIADSIAKAAEDNEDEKATK